MRSACAVAVAILFCSFTVQAVASPRLFIEAEAAATNPLDEQVIRVGVQSPGLRVFAGWYRWSFGEDVDSPGWYSEGQNNIMAGAHWFTTRNPVAVVVPCIGGGVLLGLRDTQFYSWNYDYSQGEPRLYLEERPVDETAALGFFADTGLRFRIRPTNWMLSANLHWSLSTWSRSTTQSDAYDFEKIEEQVAMLTTSLMIGAAYRF